MDDLDTVTSRHVATGTLEQVNTTTFTIRGTGAVVRVLCGRATVQLQTSSPEALPCSPLLREQVTKFDGSFYTSGAQLDEYLRGLA